MRAIDVDGLPEGLDGADRWTSIESATDEPAPDYVTHARGDLAYYRFPWKLIQCGFGTLELYHLGDDPTEEMDRAGEAGEIVETLANALTALPRGAVVNRPLWQVIWDPDFFGGEEDRAPWADTVRADP